MALRVRTFRHSKEMLDFLEDNELGTEDFKYLGQNNSGHLEIMFDDAEEILQYSSGTDGTVTLDDGDRVHRVWCVGDTGATVNIFAGGDIEVPASVWFSESFKGKLKADGAKTIVFTGTLSYFVSFIARGA